MKRLKHEASCVRADADIKIRSRYPSTYCTGSFQLLLFIVPRRFALPIAVRRWTLGLQPWVNLQGLRFRSEVAVPIIINTLKKDRVSDPMHFQARDGRLPAFLDIVSPCEFPCRLNLLLAPLFFKRAMRSSAALRRLLMHLYASCADCVRALFGAKILQM